jgi:hypothetical protein
MNRFLYLFLIFLNLIACKQNPETNNAQCNNRIEDERMNISICLPNKYFEIEKNDNYINFFPIDNDSTNLPDMNITVKVDDFKEKLSSTWYRDEQLKQYQENPELTLEVLNKGEQIIDGKKFADLEMIIYMSDNKIYSRSLFYFDKTIGYLLDASALDNKLTEESKSDILSLFRTFKIEGPPKS